MKICSSIIYYWFYFYYYTIFSVQSCCCVVVVTVSVADRRWNVAALSFAVDGLIRVSQTVFFFYFFFWLGRCGNLKANLVRSASSAAPAPPTLFPGLSPRIYDDNAFAVIIISQTQTMNFIIFPSIRSNSRLELRWSVRKLQTGNSKAFKHPLFPHAPLGKNVQLLAGGWAG